ncbi:Uncharacterised protein [Bordetella pertussis]|nr:Uncharacterised protein [Bordetella pertussis]
MPPMYFLTVSGVAATRVSPSRVSLGTPICIDASPPKVRRSYTRILTGRRYRGSRWRPCDALMAGEEEKRHAPRGALPRRPAARPAKKSPAGVVVQRGGCMAGASPPCTSAQMSGVRPPARASSQPARRSARAGAPSGADSCRWAAARLRPCTACG